MKIFKNSLKIDFNILKVFKNNSRPRNIRVGRVTGNKTFSFFGLNCLSVSFSRSLSRTQAPAISSQNR